MRRKRQDEAGSVLLEALGGIVLLCLIFFGLLQIFRWAQAKMVVEYASFYAASSHALGYTSSFTERVGRVAAIGASGRDRSAWPLRNGDSGVIGDAMGAYLANPATSGVAFEYWEPTLATAPRLRVWAEGRDNAVGLVWVERMPLLHEGLAAWVEGAKMANIPRGETVYYNYSRHYIDE